MDIYDSIVKHLIRNRVRISTNPNISTFSETMSDSSTTRIKSNYISDKKANNANRARFTPIRDKKDYW